jgi:predicted aspartyl protease
VAPAWPPESLPQLGWVEVPLARSADGLTVVEAEAVGERLLLLLDTGAATLALDRRAAERLALPLEATSAKAAGLGAGGVAVQSARLPPLALGPFTAPAAEAVVLDLATVNRSRVRRGDRPLDGVLGAAFLEAHQAVIDYPRHRLYLRPRP